MGPQPWELRKRRSPRRQRPAHRPASMGPQPWELRKREKSRRIGASWCASMGPQPWELRKLGTQSSVDTAGARFNGAAALGAAETRAVPRPTSRTSRLQWGRSLGSCGNGGNVGIATSSPTASMGPQPWELRKLDRDIRPSPYPSRLQWGRSLGSCGNMAIQIAPVRQLLTLQWGRSLGSCGNSSR